MANKDISRGGSVGIWKAVSFVLGLVLAVSSSILGWLCFGFVDHEIRLTKIEASRYTIEMAKIDGEAVLAKVPPVWVRNLLDDHSKRLERLEDKK